MAADESPFRPGGPLRNGHPETPEERARRERAEELRDRAKDALHFADLAFWAKIKEFFPEVESGELPPEAVDELARAQEKTLYHWLRWNYPDGEEIMGDIAKM